MSLLMLLAIGWMTVFSAPSDEQMQKNADPIMDNILSAIKAGNYDDYIKDFDAQMKSAVTKDNFQRTNQVLKASIGIYQSRTFGMVMEKDQYQIIIWKGQFSKQKDVMIKLVLSQINGKWKVSGLWFG